MIRKIFLVLILSLTLGCIPDYRDGCYTYKIEVKSDYDKELQAGTEEWFTNNTQYRHQYQIDFINLIAVPSYKEELKTNMPMEVMIAQAILESGWGGSDLAVDYHNYFGIKEYRKKADAAKMNTYEYINGEKKKVKANFRKYCSPEDCLADRTDWFMNNYRYDDLDFETIDWVDFTLELKNRGYATDPHYDIKLIRIIKKYKIDEYGKWMKGREINL
jgi:flagellum-specific peptidoglycan hydrolase FlgJ